MTTPTDAELQEAYDSVPAHGDQQVVHIAGLRAVLAKWGQPLAVAGGEPVAWLSVDCIGERYLCFTRPDDDDPVRPLVFGDTAPQAVREPFTPAQQERMWRRLEYIERAYDIAKGGRHGAE